MAVEFKTFTVKEACNPLTEPQTAAERVLFLNVLAQEPSARVLEAVNAAGKAFADSLIELAEEDVTADGYFNDEAKKNAFIEGATKLSAFRLKSVVGIVKANLQGLENARVDRSATPIDGDSTQLARAVVERTAAIATHEVSTILRPVVQAGVRMGFLDGGCTPEESPKKREKWTLPTDVEQANMLKTLLKDDQDKLKTIYNANKKSTTVPGWLGGLHQLIYLNPHADKLIVNIGDKQNGEDIAYMVNTADPLWLAGDQLWDFAWMIAIAACHIDRSWIHSDPKLTVPQMLHILKTLPLSDVWELRLKDATEIRASAHHTLIFKELIHDFEHTPQYFGEIETLEGHTNSKKKRDQGQKPRGRLCGHAISVHRPTVSNKSTHANRRIKKEARQESTLDAEEKEEHIEDGSSEVDVEEDHDGDSDLVRRMKKQAFVGMGDAEELLSSDTGSLIALHVKKKNYRNASDYLQEAILQLSDLCLEDAEYCHPQRIQMTYGRDDWQHTLKEGQAFVEENSTGCRVPRVLALFAGTGTGKTHALLVAPELLGIPTSVYITYNMGQSLVMDEEFMTLSIILRILLRVRGLSNAKCATFLNKFAKTTLGPLDENEFLEFATFFLKQHFSGKTSNALMVCVDEIMKLSEQATSMVLSTLGNFVVACKTEGIASTVLVSSLKAARYKTHSDRPVHLIKLPQPTLEGQRFIRDQAAAGRKLSKKQKSLIAVMGGHHYRSVVLATKEVVSNLESNVLTFAHKVRMYMDLAASAHRVRKYVGAIVRVGLEVARSDLEEDSHNLEQGEDVMCFCTPAGAISPIIVCDAFREDITFGENRHPVQQLYCRSLYTTASKQLEQCGYYYDVFRASIYAPLIPPDSRKQLHIPPRSSSGKKEKWFEELEFCVKVPTMCKDSIFITKAAPTDDDRAAKEVVLSPTWQPDRNLYWLPSDDSHPLVDRACIAQHKDNETDLCLVLYQDKLGGADGFAKAVTSLNRAASLVQARWKCPILCIVNAVDASDQTRKQSEFDFPYIIVGQPEIVNFYGPVFSAAIESVAECHHLGGNDRSSDDDEPVEHDEGPHVSRMTPILPI